MLNIQDINYGNENLDNIVFLDIDGVLKDMIFSL